MLPLHKGLIIVELTAADRDISLELTSLSDPGLGIDLLERGEGFQLEELAELIERRNAPLSTLVDAKHLDSLERDRSVASTEGSRYCVSGGRKDFDQISIPERPIYPLQVAKSPRFGLLLGRMLIEPRLQILSKLPRADGGWI